MSSITSTIAESGPCVVAPRTAAEITMTVAVVLATLVSRSIEPRSIYDARLTDEQVRARRAPPKIA